MKKIFIIVAIFFSVVAEAQMTQIQVTSVRRYTTYAEVTYKMRFTLPAIYGTGTNPIQGLSAIVSSYEGYGIEVIPVTGTVITYTKTQSVSLSTTQNQIQTGLTDIYIGIRSQLDALTLSPFDTLAGLSYNGTSWNSSSTVTDNPLPEINQPITATAASGSAVTLTIPAVKDRFHYITHISIQAYSTAARTGSATPIVVTSTNLNGLAWTFATAGAIGTTDVKPNNEPTVSLRSAVANTATTIVCPATTGVIWRVTVFYNTIN